MVAEEGAPHLPVGDDVEPTVQLQLHAVHHGPVLGSPQLRGIALTLGMARPDRLQGGGPEQRADHFGTWGRQYVGLGHG